MVSAFCLKGSNFIMVFFFFFSRCISGALSFPTTLQAKVMAAPPQPLPPRLRLYKRFWRANSFPSRATWARDVPVPVQRPLSPPVLPRDLPLPSRPGREGTPDGPRGLAPPPALAPGKGGGAGEGPQPAFCSNKHFPPPMRKPAAARGRGRVGFPPHCLPGLGPPAAGAVRRWRLRFPPAAKGPAASAQRLVSAVKLKAEKRKNRGWPGGASRAPNLRTNEHLKVFLIQVKISQNQWKMLPFYPSMCILKVITMQTVTEGT